MICRHEFGDVVLQSGETLDRAFLIAETIGRLSPDKDNVILFPTWFGGSHADNSWLIGPGRALDPRRWFIVIPNLIGNGVSISPSNSSNQPGAAFPTVTIYDNVLLQQRLLAERFGIDSIELATGASMGAIQAYHWAALFPEQIKRLAPIVGAARCARHNQVMIEGLKAALTADAAWDGRSFQTRPERGLRAFARVYAGWGFSQAFFREHLDQTALGCETLGDYMRCYWEEPFAAADPHDILTMLATWQQADIAANERFDGNFAAALAAITARTIVMPSATDLYFPPADSAIEAAGMGRAELRVIPSVWGHHAGPQGLCQTDVAFIDAALRQLIGEE